MKKVIAALIALIAILLIALVSVTLSWADKAEPEQFGGTWETLEGIPAGTWE